MKNVYPMASAHSQAKGGPGNKGRYPSVFQGSSLKSLNGTPRIAKRVLISLE